MSAGQQTELKAIRLVFELARADNPRLFDELNQFPQGQKRVNRLRVLAYDGLLAQSGVFAGIGHGLPHQPSANSAQEGSGEVTNDIFAPAIDG